MGNFPVSLSFSSFTPLPPHVRGWNMGGRRRIGEGERRSEIPRVPFSHLRYRGERRVVIIRERVYGMVAEEETHS